MAAARNGSLVYAEIEIVIFSNMRLNFCLVVPHLFLSFFKPAAPCDASHFDLHL